MKRIFRILLLGALLAFVADEASAVAKTATAAGGGTWATATWSPAGVPAAGDTCTINSGVNLSVNTAAVCGSLTLGNATITATTLTLAAGGSLDITTAGGQTGNVVLNPSNVNRAMTIAAVTQTVTIAGTVTCSATNTQTISVSTGQVFFTRAAGLTWANCVLTVTNNNAGGSANFTGLLTQNSGTIQNTTTAGTIDFDGGYTKTGGTFTTLAGETINFGNSLTVSTTALVFNATSTQNFINTATITPTANITFGNLTINPGAGKTVTLAGNLLGVAGNLSVSTGTYDLAAFTSNRTAAGGTITVSNGALLKIGGTNPFPTNYSAFALGATSTVEYSGTTQNVASAVGASGYGHLILSGTLTKTALGTFTVRGNLSITGVTFAGTTFTHTVNGNVSNTGTHTATTGSITLSGGTAAHALSGAGTYANLVLNDANGATLSASPTVSGTLTLTSGVMTTGANTMITTANCTVPSVLRTAGHVAGFLRMAIPLGAPNCTYHVGDSATYRPINVVFASVTGAGNLTGSVSQSAGDHPNIATSGLDSSKSVNRYWTLTNAGVAFTTYSVTLTFFVPGDPDGGANTANFEIERWNGTAWNTTTVGARTGTTTQATGITVLEEFAIAEKVPVISPPGDLNAFETSTLPNPGAITGPIYTKLVGVNFSLDVVAILGGVQHAAFTDTVQVDLVTGATGGLGCGSPTAIAGTSQNVNLTGGRGTTGSFNVAASAYRDVRVRIRYPVASPTVTSCSTNNFSIRPTAFSSVTAPVLTNSGSSGIPFVKAGDSFTLDAVAGAGYNGTPSIDNTTITAHAGAIQIGNLAGTFGAANPATGTAQGTSFTYSEVGNFRIGVNGVYDSSFTSVDAPGTDCTNDFSNSLDGSGRYGCRFGNSVASAAIGRFTPDNFNVSYNVPVFLPACTGFTYAGQAFNYSPALVITVTARNSSALGSATTKNYRGVWRKITNATLTYPGGTDRGYRTLSGTLVTSGLPVTDPTIADGGVGAEGTVTFTFSSGTGLLFQRTAPVAPFDAEISLAIHVIDEDSVAYASNPAKFGNEVAGGGIVFSDLNPGTTNDKSIRFGRVRLNNANGSQLVALPMLMETQYWNGSSFITNADDGCTSISAANVGLGNYTGNLNSGETTPSIAVGTFSKGRKTLTMSAPGAANNGSVDVVLNLGTSTTIDSCLTWGTTPTPPGANLVHLRGQWCGATHTKDPTARATFGAYRGSEEVIHIRENF